LTANEVGRQSMVELRVRNSDAARM